MRRKHKAARMARRVSTVSLWLTRGRFFWYRLNKTPLVVATVLLVVGGLVTLALASMLADARERQALNCLAMNVYFEARGEPEVGQYAVAEVTMNRVASPRYPNSVCAVVYQKNWDALRKRHVSAFSWTELDSVATPQGKEWERAREIAHDVYYERVPRKLAGVLHFHADYVTPSWSRGQTPVAAIGNHRFYK